MVDETNKDDFFPVYFQKVYPLPHSTPDSTPEAVMEIKREIILQNNKKLALVKYSKSEGNYIFGTISVKDDKTYEIKPVDKSNEAIELVYSDLEELIVQAER